MNPKNTSERDFYRTYALYGEPSRTEKPSSERDFYRTYALTMGLCELKNVTESTACTASLREPKNAA